MNRQNSNTRMGSAEVAAVLRKDILREKLGTHERLPSERVLSRTHQVSRGTIREALLRLEQEGLVQIRAGSGTYVLFSASDQTVSAIEQARPLELVDARFALEPHLCRLAVLHATTKDFERLEGLLVKMENAESEPRKFGEYDTSFHSALAESTGNNLLVWIISQINSVRKLDEWSRMRNLTLTRSTIQTYNRQHRQIVTALRSREPEKAASLMKEHLEFARLSITRAAET